MGMSHTQDNLELLLGSDGSNFSLNTTTANWDYNSTTVNCTDSNLTSLTTPNVLCQGANDTRLDPSYYAITYKIIGTIFQGFILFVGVLGNVMVVIVVLRTKSMKTPTNCYLVSLSIADLMVLIAAVPNEIISYYVLGDQWIWGRFGCAMFIFLQYLGINVSSLSITSFTIERYIAICHPMKAQKMCTVHRAKRIICGVWIFALIYCSPWIFLTKVEPVRYKGHDNIETCTFALSRKHYLGYFFADLILFYVFPLLLSCVLYGLIARVLFKNDIPKSTKKSRNGTTTAYVGDSKKTSSANDSARVQVVKMLVVVVAVFATLWLPYRAWLVYNSFAENRYMELWFLMFCKTMIFVNSAINPILYNALSVKFRRAFKRMFSCDCLDSNKRNGNNSRPRRGQTTSVHVSQNSSRHNPSTLTTCTMKTTSCKIEKFQEDL